MKRRAFEPLRFTGSSSMLRALHNKIKNEKEMEEMNCIGKFHLSGSIVLFRCSETSPFTRVGADTVISGAKEN